MMVVGHAFYNPIKALLSIDEAFARYASADSEIDLTLPKLAFIGCNAAMLALALWKLNTMRLLNHGLDVFLVDKVDHGGGLDVRRRSSRRWRSDKVRRRRRRPRWRRGG